MADIQVRSQQLSVERVSVVSAKTFEQVIAAIESAVGHPDIAQFWKATAAAKNLAELEDVIQRVLGTSGFIEFARFDHGRILAVEAAGKAPKIYRFVIGNPLIMKEMAKYVSDAGSYAPVTILVDERADGVHLSYDKMASYLAPYGNLAALSVALQLDLKVEALLKSAA